MGQVPPPKRRVPHRSKKTVGGNEQADKASSQNSQTTISVIWNSIKSIQQTEKCLFRKTTDSG